MKKTLCFLGCLILSLSLKCQLPLIQGQVISQDGRQPLAGAHVVAKGETYGGALSNEDGRFSLHLPPDVDSVQLSHLGYRTLTLPVQTFGEAGLVVRLQPEAILLQAIEVNPISARALVQEAIARIPKNYDPEPHLHAGFFRETIQDQQGYLSVAEGLFEAAYFPDERAKEQLQLRLIKGRRSEDVRATRLFEDFHPAGSPHRLAGLHLAIHRPTYLQDKYLDQYEYWLDSMAYFDGKALYVISFDQRPSVKEAFSKGRLYIDKESRAIVRMEAGISPRGEQFVQHLSGADKLFAKLLHIEFLIRRSDVVVEFENFRGKWYLNNAAFHHSIAYRQPNKELNLSLEVYEELLITGLQKDSILPFHRLEQWDRKQLMLSLPSEYDEAFWGASNHILPSQRLLDIVAAMEKEAAGGHLTIDSLSGEWVLANAAQAKAFQSGRCLYLKPYTESEWMDERTGPMLKKEYTGDFQFEAMVEVQSASDTTRAPDKGFQKGGILVRDPESGQENYLMIGLGTGGNPKLKVGGMYTRDGKSSVAIDKPGLSRLRLRIRRRGAEFRLSYQIPRKEEWVLLREEKLPGFPETVELGLAGYTHFPGNAPAMKPDLIVKFSEINIR